MKITRRGLPKEQRRWIGTCNSCHSEAEAIESEMTHKEVDFKDHDEFSWEVCPACGAGDKVTGYDGMLFYVRKEPPHA